MHAQQVFFSHHTPQKRYRMTRTTQCCDSSPYPVTRRVAANEQNDALRWTPKTLSPAPIFAPRGRDAFAL